MGVASFLRYHPRFLQMILRGRLGSFRGVECECDGSAESHFRPERRFNNGRSYGAKLIGSWVADVPEKG
jgi:hypothetical protein